MVKTKKNDLDVDFIGGQEALTEKEQSEISKFFDNQKTKRSSTKSLGRKSQKRQSISK
jgi:hypothetical protein